MKNEIRSVEEYILQLPDDRKTAVSKLLDVIRENLPKGFSEGISYGMPGWVVPHTAYPAGYHCDPKQPLPFLSISSTKGHITLHHLGLYAGELTEWFSARWQETQTAKPDLGKGCVRFRKPEQIPFDLIGELAAKITPADWIRIYEQNFKR